MIFALYFAAPLVYGANVPPYVIFQDAPLCLIARENPATAEAPERLAGIGPRKIGRYGEAVLNLLNP